MDGYRVADALAVFLITFWILVSLPAPGGANDVAACGQQAEGPFDTTALSVVVTGTLESEFDKAFGVLAQANCPGLKPGVFNMGACKDGWSCISNDLACFCVPPD